MSLIYCPECGNEVSNTAVACPNCGRPISSIPVLKETVIRTPVREDSDIPKWVFIPIGILGVVVVFLAFMFFSRNSDDANMNISVAANRAPNSRTDDRTVSTVPGSSTTIPSSAPIAPPVTDSQTVNVPGTGGTAPAETRGRVVVDAKVTASNGQTRPVRNEKFYLLDKDLEAILSEADLDPIEGQSLSTSFGLSVTFPDRYGDFNRQALAAIRPHIKHSATSDGSGKASFGNIEPDNYYLFGVTRGNNSFALWSSPVSIRAGENVLQLTPQPLTDVG
jgi:hypothetical protein